MTLRYQVSITTKLIIMVTLIIVAAIANVTKMAMDLYRDEATAQAQERNESVANHLSDRIQAYFQDDVSKMMLMARFSVTQNESDARLSLENILSESSDMLSFALYKIPAQKSTTAAAPELRASVFNSSLLADSKVDRNQILSQTTSLLFPAWRAQHSPHIWIVNSSKEFRSPVFTVVFTGTSFDRAAPAAVGTDDGSQWFVRADFRHDSFARFFSKQGHVNAYILDPKGEILAHSDPRAQDWVMKGASFRGVDIVDRLLSEPKTDNLQMRYVSADNTPVFGAFHRVGFAGTTVVAEIPESEALAAIQKFKYRAGLTMIVVVCLAFILNFIFSQSITQPLRNLFEATSKIVDGKFDVNLQSSSNDEVGALSVAFNKMAAGLKERDRLKGVFNKFHSKEIAKKLLSGEIRLGGQKKQATVFFSDIRSFTQMSEHLTPDQVVSMLNEYMTEMVKIIYKWSGVVDKYIGDAIMAVWGVPETHPEDAYRATRACLDMRDFMVGFNKMRVQRGDAELKIGMGLHTGIVLAGNIGSEERLEYTVIGDTVNIGSRVESATKVFSGDFLITEATAALVRDLGIVVGPALQMKAKGKRDNLVVHKVIGYMNEESHLVTSLTLEQQAQILAETNLTAIDTAESKIVAVMGTEQTHASKMSSAIAESSGAGPIAREEAPPVIDDRATARMRQRLDDADELDQARAQRPHFKPVPQEEDMPPVEEETYWVLEEDEPEIRRGPYTAKALELKVRQGQISRKSFVITETSDTPTRISQLAAFVRKPMPPIRRSKPPRELIEEADPEEWYIAGPGDEVLGPYTAHEIHRAMERGFVTRTTYVWNRDVDNWQHIFEIPGFERRSA